MKLPRFRVATVEGFPIVANRDPRPSGMAQPELSAHVLDSLHLYQLVATYRSTDRIGRPAKDGKHGGGTTRGHAGALAAAEDHAARLEKVHRQWLHREHMREKRGELV